MIRLCFISILFAGLVFTSCERNMGPGPIGSGPLLRSMDIYHTYSDTISIIVDSDSSFLIGIPTYDISPINVFFPQTIKNYGWEKKVYDLFWHSESLNELNSSESHYYTEFLCEEFRNISVTANKTLWGREPGTELNDLFSLAHNPEVILVPRTANADYAFPYGYDVVKPENVSDWIDMNLFFPTRIRMSIRETPPEYPQPVNLTVKIIFVDYTNSVTSREMTLENVVLSK